MIEILLPYYGDPAMMRAAVMSVRAQTSNQWQLLVVDDSTADTDLAVWITGLSDLRIRYTRNTGRLGVAGNFNRCVDLSTGSHLVVMGCDDLMEPDYVARMDQALHRHHGAAAVHPAVVVMDENGQPGRWAGDLVKKILRPTSTGDRVLAGESFAARLLTGMWTYFPAICWDGDFLRRHRFRHEFETVLDMALLLELALDGRSFVLTSDKTFRYRRHSSSASSVSARTSLRFDEERALLLEMAGRMDAVGWTSAARSARRHLTSRLHALLLVSSALRSGAAKTRTRPLVRHALAPLADRTRRFPERTRGETAQRWYAERLASRGGARWKILLDVQAPYRWMLRRLDLGRTLDIGCGVGRNLLALDSDSVGVDHNVHAVALARRRGLRALSTEDWCTSASDEQGRFDSLLLAHVIEHMSAAEAVTLLNAYLPALRPGGRVVVVCPQQRGFRSDPTHVQHFSGADMAALLSGVPCLRLLRSWSFPLPALAGQAFTYNETWVMAEKLSDSCCEPAAAGQVVAATHASSFAAAAPESTAAAARSMPVRRRSSRSPSVGS